MQTDPCTICGAISRRACEMDDELGFCPWDEIEPRDEPDPDILREDRDERRRLEKEAGQSDD